jgi:hypothetical protein
MVSVIPFLCLPSTKIEMSFLPLRALVSLASSNQQELLNGSELQEAAQATEDTADRQVGRCMQARSNRRPAGCSRYHSNTEKHILSRRSCTWLVSLSAVECPATCGYSQKQQKEG